MKLQLRISPHLLGMVLVFAAVSALGFSSMQSAFALPDPSSSYTPGSIVRDTVANMLIEQPAGNAETYTNAIRVYDTTRSIALTYGGIGIDSCPDTVGGPDVWILVDKATGKNVGFKFEAGGPIGSFKTSYGTDVGDSSTNTVKVIVNSDTYIRLDGADQTKGVGLDNAYWKPVAPTTNLINTANAGGKQSFLTCGIDAGDDYKGGGSLSISKPVGGEIIPINTTALLLAGVSTSALWLVPLTAVALGAFVVLRLQVNRK